MKFIRLVPIGRAALRFAACPGSGPAKCRHHDVNTQGPFSSHDRYVMRALAGRWAPTQICRTGQSGPIRHISRHNSEIGPIRSMSALANHAFAKMNGIGNEIVVVDLRDAPAAVTAEDARAVASPAGVPYDQLMVLQPPRLAGTEAFIRIYNNDGSEAEACGNGMRCVVRRQFEKTGQTAVTYRNQGRPAELLAGPCARSLHRRHGRAEVRLEGYSAGGRVSRHPLDRTAGRPDRRAGAAFAVGGQHGQSACDLLGRRCQRL